MTQKKKVHVLVAGIFVRMELGYVSLMVGWTLLLTASFARSLMKPAVAETTTGTVMATAAEQYHSSPQQLLEITHLLRMLTAA